jgi:hypothetical protein
MWLNKVKVAWKYLPLRYCVSVAVTWGVWYLVKSKGDVVGFLGGWGTIFRVPKEERRRPLGAAARAYLKKVKARLAY